jgi:hypothetical protein
MNCFSTVFDLSVETQVTCSKYIFRTSLAQNADFATDGKESQPNDSDRKTELTCSKIPVHVEF